MIHSFGSGRFVFGLALGLCLILSSPSSAQSLDPESRGTRDAERLQRAKTRNQDKSQRDDWGESRRVRQRAALDNTRANLAQAEAHNETLAGRANALGDDLAQLHAVTVSTLQSQRARLQRGPLAADQQALIDQVTTLAQKPPSLNLLYDTWFALHDEWLAAGRVQRTEQPVTFVDGARRVAPLTRYGAIALGHKSSRLIVDLDVGLLADPGATSSRGNAEYFAQQVYDSGAIGVALLGCAILALVTLIRRRRHASLNLIASASLLLGLLGTVVGLIHTFRALARYGGADAGVAAAGISHALSTTWMGLVVAISLMLIQAVLSMLPKSAPKAVAATRAESPTARWRRGRMTSALCLATALTIGLFFLMQWLTHRPLSPPAPSDTVLRVQRIDWDAPPPPPPSEPPPPTTASALPSTPAFALGAVTPLPAPVPNPSAPALNLAPSLSGLGSGDVPAAGTLWRGASTGEALLDGKDLVPISSARPRYPKAALVAGMDGWVEAIFRIDASGRVSNVRIIDAEPPGVFEQAAAQALERWLYSPLYKDGQPVAREATQLLRFRHSEARNTYTGDDR